MLSERVKEWTRDWEAKGLQRGMEKGLKQGLEQGREQGLEQGIEQGRRLGEAELLRRQLIRRFGDLPTWALDRLDAASSPELECWAERILDASSLESVFQPD